MIFNLKIEFKKRLNLLNLFEIYVFGIYKLIKIIIIVKNKSLYLQLFK